MNKIKKLTGMFLAFVMLVAVFSSINMTVYADFDVFHYEIKNGEATITSTEQELSGDVVVPSTYNGYPVTAIADNALSYRKFLMTLSIPASVKSIPEINDCENLSGITVDADNEKYSSDGGVLFNKDKSVLIRVPQGYAKTSYDVPETVKVIATHAFNKCFSITNLPESVKTIEAYAFSGCVNMSSIKLPTEMESIGKYAFDACQSLTSVKIPNGIKNGSCRRISKLFGNFIADYSQRYIRDFRGCIFRLLKIKQTYC